MLVPPSLGAGAAGNRRASTIHGLANGGKLQVGLSEETVLCVLLAQRASLIGYIWSMAGDAHLVEDVFQEVAVLALEKRGELRDEKALPTWLRRAARLSVLALIRAQKKSPLLLSDATLDLLGECWEEKTSSHSSADRMAALHECLNRLSPNARQIIALRYMDGLSGIKVAETLNRRIGTIYTALSRIHRRLRECMQSRLNEETANG